MMSSDGSELSAKERIGYEVFFFTAVYGLYNVFFSNPVFIDAIVFATLFGSLFVRYHLVVSGKELSDSAAARWTGTWMFVVSVAIASHLAFRNLNAVTSGFEASVEPYLILVGGAVCGLLLFAVFNHPVFRHDRQRRETFKKKAEKEGAIGLIARIGLFFEKQSDTGNYKLDIENTIDFDESRRLLRKQREGEISPQERNKLRQELKDYRDTGEILVVGFHAAASIVILLFSTVLVQVLTSFEAVKMLGLILLVTGVYYSFLMLHTRFGLRREVSREIPKMPMELLLCIIVAFGTLSSAGLIGGAAVITTILFTFYLLSDQGVWISQKIIWTLMSHSNRALDNEYREVVKEVMEKKDS